MPTRVTVDHAGDVFTAEATPHRVDVLRNNKLIATGQWDGAEIRDLTASAEVLPHAAWDALSRGLADALTEPRAPQWGPERSDVARARARDGSPQDWPTGKPPSEDDE